MLKYFVRFFSVILATQLYVGDIRAGSGTIELDGECTESAGCKDGLWCKPEPLVGKTCQPCTNKPTDQNGKACGEGGALCQYTGTSANGNACPWTMVCLDSYLPPTNSGNNSCITCQGHYEFKKTVSDTSYDAECTEPQKAWILAGHSLDQDPGDNDSQNWCNTNFPNNGSCYLCLSNVYSVASTISAFSSNNTVYNPHNFRCVGKIYTVTLNKNIHGTTATETVYKQYDGSWMKTNTDPVVSIDSIPIPTNPQLKKFLGYFTAQTGGTMVINERGVPQDNAEITGETTLYAHWGDYIPYNIYFTHPDETMNPYYVTCTTGPVCNLYEKDANDACHSMQYSMCDLHESCGNDEDGQKMQLNITSGYGSLSSDGKTITLGDVAKNEIYNNMNFTTGASSVTVGSVTLSECTAGYYCNMCVETKCPYGSTSTAGASATSDCYLDPANLQFKDSTGKTFSLPISNSKLKILLK